ncbi:MAG: DNA mismatch repair protein MutS [Candidatus Schekmanbacteria bacterium RBG_13_48_7]|uniref:DNA mismatch repair protein MutS n=1 Tax=Candidatus Schekmanbacteria bacterium RBG_13_48_7 TaxID=1817878 RepID=A0A1F7RXE4_9BACT|nr:MAG: DNA mismatch repair protein MutS [Candidatus Schekmanbacteria bacterium RBG_13_48_7]
MQTKITPMMQQYKKIKNQHPGSILMFRMGDFYEMFFEDAVLASKVLNIALTSRERGEKENRIPMCGVPYHSVDPYIAKLIGSGYRVAICDQLEDPKKARGIVKRDVTRVITPGTLVESHLLNEKENNYLASINVFPVKNSVIGFSFLDLSTGDFFVCEFEGDKWLSKFIDEFERLNPKEILIADSEAENSFVKTIGQKFPSVLLSTCPEWYFDSESAFRTLTRHFKTKNLEGYGIVKMTSSITSAGALLQYVEDTQKGALNNITKIKVYNVNQYMVLDESTTKNLELIVSLDGYTKQGSLLDLIDQTRTAMGGRLMKYWLLHPLLDKEQIKHRQNGIEELKNSMMLREKLQDTLKSISDLERLISRISLEAANPRDVVALKNSIQIVPALKILLSEAVSTFISDISNGMEEMPDVVNLIENSIVDSPPVALRDGGIIKPGYNSELDEIRDIRKSGKDWITKLEAAEKSRTNIPSLKVRFNKVFGYYIEITKTHLSKVPQDYIRKQTMVNAERFITPDLKEFEAKVLNAEERINDLEFELFETVRKEVALHVSRIQKLAQDIALLDVAASLAEVAFRFNYTRPDVDDSYIIEIKEGRHPVLEQFQMDEPFIANDTSMNCDANRLLIITGPNMAGKSTYMRQVALIVLMAQTGSFVPCDSAHIGIVDRIFTRVGASDRLLKGQSTFMVEMSETANILNNASKRSLILLDEIGRGTSTFDGLSIAWAAAEFIHDENKIGAKTLFATHYHELTDLASTNEGVKNYSIAVREWNDEVVFLRKVVEGGTDRSYGIQVARLAGLPIEIIERAKEILANLEANELDPEGKPALARTDKPKSSDSPAQLHLFAGLPNPIEKILDSTNINNLTPLEALALVDKMKKMLKKLP